MQDIFVPGQRWMSEAEPDLGIGLLERSEGRQLVVRFRARNEVRTYAIATAPLHRVRFATDDVVQDAGGHPWTVIGVAEHGGLLHYRCTNGEGEQATLDEGDIDDRMPMNRPEDRLLTRRIDADVWFTLRYQSWLRAAQLWRSPVYGLCGPRVQVLPHQLYIASEVAGRHAPRVLLADEVGLGKTIEAGLIMHRLLMTERVQRVLIVVPEALLHQWMVEMLRRFNLPFAVFDAERFDAASSEQPFQTEQRVLCSLEFLVSRKAIGQAVLAGEWDLLIVDEAHHLHWDKAGAGEDYELIEGLARQTPSVLLLTATPEQLGRVGHFGRLHLLDPERFHDYDAFLDEEAQYEPIAELAVDLDEGRPLNVERRVLLQALLGEDVGAGRQTLERLVDHHGTGRVLFRNTRHAVKGFPRRRLHDYALERPQAYADHAHLLSPETGFGEGWCDVDPRVPWLRELQQRLAPDKVLVICASPVSVVALRDFLLTAFGIHVAVFHEHLDLVARDRAAAFFADPEGAQVLLCSEIGSEGRNFQFAHHLVLFDLPQQPDLLEQRIGRLDRIGQRDTIELHVPVMRNTAGEVMLRWYRDGLGSLQQICPAASAVYAQQQSTLAEALANVMVDPSQADALVAEAAALTTEINATLARGRDRLLELNSHRPQLAAKLVDAVEEAEDTASLQDFLVRFWDAFGLEHEPGPGRSVIVRRGTHMLSEQVPGMPLAAASVTFDRGDALAHEDRQFLTWEHPISRGSMELLNSGELGTAAITVCEHPDYRTGSVLLEALFVVECISPPGLELQRFLPPTCIRVLLDRNGQDRTEEHPHDTLSGHCLSQNRKLVETVIKSQAAVIPLLQQRAEALVEADRVKQVTAAREEMRRELDAARDRLVVLARVNRNVRDAEIDAIDQRRQKLDVELAGAKARLDALRLIVMR